MDITISASAVPQATVDLARFVGDLLKRTLTRTSAGPISRLSLLLASRLFLLVLSSTALVVARAREFVCSATEQDRPQLLEVAKRLSALVTTLDDSQHKLEQKGITRSLPIRGRLILRRLSELAEDADDVAENAALSASADFADFVHQELATTATAIALCCSPSMPRTSRRAFPPRR